MSNIYVVGDIHGYWTFLNSFINRKRPDIILQCGDFGYWPKFDSTDLICENPLSRNQDPWNFFGIKCQDTKIYFCDGNHEDHWELKKFKIPTIIYDNIWYMPRASVLVLPDDRNVLFMGGAQSIDAYCRTIGFDWFPEEVINYQDFLKLDNIFEMFVDKIDIVISHTCPLEFFENGFNKKFLITDKMKDPSCIVLSRILEKFNPSLWYFGHFHESAEGKYNDTRWFAMNQANHSGWYRKLL